MYFVYGKLGWFSFFGVLVRGGHLVPVWTANAANGYHVPLWFGKVHRHRIERFFRRTGRDVGGCGS